MSTPPHRVAPTLAWFTPGHVGHGWLGGTGRTPSSGGELPGPAWLRHHHPDLVHLRLGSTPVGPREATALVADLAALEVPLVLTVRDLCGPRVEDCSLHHPTLDVLVPAAAGLTTCTPGAAAEILRRWDRRPVVVPHPQVVDDRRMSVAAGCRARRRSPTFRLGLQVGRPRPAVDPLVVLPVLVEVAQALPRTTLQVDVWPEGVDAAGTPHDRALATFLLLAAERGMLELRTHHHGGPDALTDHLGDLDAVVLPYCFGAHSTMLEACRDLGTTVIAPTSGWFTEQGTVVAYDLDETDLDTASLARAVARVHAERPRLGATVDERYRQRRAAAAAHDELHAAALAG